MVNIVSKKNLALLKKYVGDTAGVSAIVLAMSMPVLMAASGTAVDLAQAYNVKMRLGNALDKAALAAATTVGSEEEVEQRVMDFFNANYPEERIGAPYDIIVTLGEDSVTVSASARVDTTFMAVLGDEFTHINVHESTSVMREVRGLEVVMVLDNTGSMSTNNNIATLRTASENFVNILFDAAGAGNEDDIRIGMVPYASSVRVAHYALGLHADGTQYDDGATFVNLPAGISYTTNKASSTGWYGCVVDHMSTNYNAAATHVPNTYGQFWTTAAACTTASNCRGHGWDASSTANDPYPNDLPDDYQGPWDIYMYGTYTRNCSGTCTPKYTFNKASQPNVYCPWAHVLPLTSDRTSLITNIGTMRAEGATLSNTGIAWGYRLLSQDPPFTEGSAWGDEDWRKAILFMTDGETSMGGNYTSYWFTSRNNIDNAALDARLLEICNDLKAADKDVTIYTVTFAAGVTDATKAAYQSCATSDAHYFDAPSQSDLIDAFEAIARQLSSLRIVD